MFLFCLLILNLFSFSMLLNSFCLSLDKNKDSFSLEFSLVEFAVNSLPNEMLLLLISD